ncbi:translocation/assembly module TamB domain-containing protein [Marinobacterium sp. AK62]|uniref:Translocation/assembly module TamB domain-containing protein n=1 Tax=Marinobacterium alkalitolerans TaxID=1542925 RepID=A0ABS3ZBP9_9GAMM|nr:translocation/assembly module TamB domain-containing protein [Marinobacterium alkalitolerans]MBP0049135.1 translocation/assembly module TamB domain-containing protein [Marinobacterium alkalitolerans]
MRLWLRWGLGSLLILLLLVLSLLASILFLPSGTRFALNLVSQSVPQLSLSGVEGTLTDELRIQEVSLELPAQNLLLEDLLLRWDPWRLFEPHLTIHELSLGRVKLDLLEQDAADDAPDPEQPPGLPELPVVELPLGFSLDQLVLQRVELNRDGQPLTGPVALMLGAHSDQGRILLDQVELIQGETRVSLSGWTEPGNRFTSHLDGRVIGRIEDWWAPEHWQASKPFELKVQAEFEGNERTVDLVTDLSQDKAQLSLEAAIALAEGLDLRYSLKAAGLDPALAAPDWPGQLALDAEGSVVMARGEPQLSLNIQQLKGVLREQPLALSGQVRGGLSSWQLEAIQLRYAGASADAGGELGLERLNLNWSLKVPELAKLLPQAQGRLALEGQVSGPLLTPSVNARANVSNVQYADQLTLKQLQGPIKVDLSGQSDWQTDLRLEALEAGGQRIQQARLIMDGLPEQHRIRLTADAEQGVLQLQLNGGWQPQLRQWAGELVQLDLNPTLLSHWQSTAAAGLEVSPEHFMLKPLCLNELTQGGNLCVSGEGTFGEQLAANVDLKALPLSLLTPLLNGAELTPALTAQLAFTQAAEGAPRLQAVIETSAGEFTPSHADQALPLQPVRINALLENDRLTAQADTELALVAGSLGLNLEVAELSKRQRLQGKVELSASDLSLVEVMVPELQNMAGRLDAEFTLAGTLSEPAVNGDLNFSEGRVEVPVAGLLLDPLEFSASPVNNGQGLVFSGRVGSGDGQLELDGEYDLTRQSGQVVLKGEDFTAMNTAEAQADISPDLRLNLSPELINLTGSVRIPRVLVATPESRESAVTPNADVVVLEDGALPKSEPAVPLSANIDVILGDDVRVDALGFKGRLLGQLNVEETPGQATRATGSIQVESGEYRLYGQDLEIRRGSLVYAAGPIDNPGLDLRVGRKVDDVVVGANVSGTLREPRMDLYGEPAMPDSSVLSYLLLGKAPGESSSGEQQMLTQAALSLSMSGGNKVTDQLRDSLSLDELGFDSSGAEGSAFFIGKYLSPRLYLRYGIGVMDAVNTLSLKYKLTDTWRVEAQSSALGSGADILYTIER